MKMLLLKTFTPICGKQNRLQEVIVLSRLEWQNIFTVGSRKGKRGEIGKCFRKKQVGLGGWLGISRRVGKSGRVISIFVLEKTACFLLHPNLLFFPQNENRHIKYAY